MLSRLTVKSKLILLLAVAIGASVLIGAAGILGLRTTSASIEEIGVVRLPSVIGLAMIRDGQNALHAANRDALGMVGDSPSHEKFLALLRQKQDLWARIDQGWHIYEPLPQTPEESQLWQQFVREWNEWKNGDQKISDTILALGESRNTAEQHRLFAELKRQLEANTKKFAAAETSLWKIVELNADVANAAMQDGRAGAASTNALILIIGAGAVCTLMFLGIFIVRSILRQLGGDPLYVSQVASRIAAGDLDVRLETQQGDTGSMLVSINHMVRQLQKREQEFRAMVENSPDIIIRYDTCCRRLYVNPALKALLGFTSEQVLGKTPEEITPLLDVPGYLHMVQQALTTGHEVQGEVAFRDARGVVRWGHTRFVPEFGAGGQVVSLLAISRDMSERKQLEHELEGAQAQLRGLLVHREQIRDEERKLIAREVHDELGQILSSLKLTLSLLIHKYGTESQPLREHAQQSLEMAAQAIGVVRNIIAVLRATELDLGIVAALKSVTERFGVLTGIQCDSHIEELPLNSEQAAALFRIAQESLTNIARHAGADNVALSLTREADEYVLKVRDNGKGFAAEVVKPDSFGLLGMRERALMLGGTLTINSREGKGTEIIVRIPKGNHCD